ncbi:MAG: hypothetical protein FD161_2626 [Limisphaerales bacterium]|nr:MAG: hypothetical protein FD161_2626 [Limisphaerales bacterium]KAG0508443.1 MAG: hypothetical protein E1N63_2377 [Limisphaerales bacterium]TXT47909.1 MAG: hypothetical protein FD140_3952 [Limisphaerales bacterium]
MKVANVIHKERGHVMCRLIKEASFDEWLTYLFDRPECEYGGHWSFGRPDDEPVWDAPREVSAEFIARTYEDPKFWMGRFTNAQIAAGLEYTWNPSYSDVGFAIRDEPTPMPLRLRAVRALVPLYQNCFQSRCDAGLSHLSERLDNPMNGACYMYWDVSPFVAQPEKPEPRLVDQECLKVMEVTLQIDHDACRESALHGLGHWQSDYPARVASLIEQGLKHKGAHLRPELLRYAAAAVRGDVQ